MKINYVEKVEITDRVTDTNIEGVARDADIYSPEDALRYRPLPIIVGSHRPTEGLDDALLDIQVGDERDFQVPPEKAYGTRDPKLVDRVPLGFLRRQGITPVRGLPIRTRKGLAIIRSITGGRVRLDYNHPLAGRVLAYHVEVAEEAKNPETKLRWLIEMRLPGIDSDSHIVEVDEGKASVELNVGDLSVEDVGQLRSLLERDVSQHLPEVTQIIFGPPEEGERESGEASDEETESEGEGEEKVGAGESKESEEAEAEEPQGGF